MKREKEDEEEDKKVVVPPVDRNLLPAADRAELHAETQHVGSRKALRLHAAYHAQKSACARCSPSPCPLGAWEVAIEPQPDRSVPPSERAAAAAAAKGRLVGRSSPEGFPPKKRKPVIEAAARATGRGADTVGSVGGRDRAPTGPLRPPIRAGGGGGGGEGPIGGPEQPGGLPAEEKKACDRGGGESHRARRTQLRQSWRPATAPCSP
jgi:hypothetical protein